MEPSITAHTMLVHVPVHAICHVVAREYSYEDFLQVPQKATPLFLLFRPALTTTAAPLTCPEDYSTCGTMVQTYGASYYCSFYSPLCPGPCGQPCKGSKNILVIATTSKTFSIVSTSTITSIDLPLCITICKKIGR